MGRPPLWSSMYIFTAMPIWRRLEIHGAIWAFCRAVMVAGRSKAARIPITTITTRSSIKLKPRRPSQIAARLEVRIFGPLGLPCRRATSQEAMAPARERKGSGKRRGEAAHRQPEEELEQSEVQPFGVREHLQP